MSRPSTPTSRPVRLTSGWDRVVDSIEDQEALALANQRLLGLLGRALWREAWDEAEALLARHPPLDRALDLSPTAAIPAIDILRPDARAMALGTSGWTLLMAMAYHNHLPAVRWLVAHGALPGLSDQMGRDAAWWVTDAGHTEMALWLLSRRQVAPMAVLRDGTRLTRLMAAVRARNPKVVALLLQRRVPVDVHDANGRTALHHNARQTPYTEDDALIAALLLAHHANPDWVDNEDMTPRLLASRDAAVEAALLAEPDPTIRRRVAALPSVSKPPLSASVPAPESPAPDATAPEPSAPRPGPAPRRPAP